MRQDVVSELTEKEQIFYNIEAVISRFLDIDHILSQCVQLPKQETVKTAENKITNVMYLKHTLELIEPLREALGDCENPLLKASYKVIQRTPFITHLIITRIWVQHGNVVAPKFFKHGILQKIYRKINMKWTFSYNFFVKLSL